jgi:hypothetical protein
MYMFSYSYKIVSCCSSWYNTIQYNTKFITLQLYDNVHVYMYTMYNTLHTCTVQCICTISRQRSYEYIRVVVHVKYNVKCMTLYLKLFVYNVVCTPLWCRSLGSDDVEDLCHAMDALGTESVTKTTEFGDVTDSERIVINVSGLRIETRLKVCGVHCVLSH